MDQSTESINTPERSAPVSGHPTSDLLLEVARRLTQAHERTHELESRIEALEAENGIDSDEFDRKVESVIEEHDFDSAIESAIESELSYGTTLDSAVESAVSEAVESEFGPYGSAADRIDSSVQSALADLDLSDAVEEALSGRPTTTVYSAE